MSNKLKAYKFRIYPNKQQEILLNKTFGCVRYAWNQNVAIFLSCDKEDKPNPKFKTSTELRKDISWMREVSSTSIQQKERDFDQFKRQFFNKNRKSRVGKPSFKKRSNRQSFRLSNTAFKIHNGKIQLSKIGRVKIVMDRELPEQSKLMSVTVSKNPSGQYFASVVVEQEINHKPKTNKDVGVDVGIKKFSVQSDGNEISNPKYFIESQAKLKRLQQHFSRKQKGSNRREKCRLKIAKLHQKIVNQRQWFLHDYSTRLINNYDTIYIEDLDVRGLLERKQLSKHIADASWSEFFRMLQYKADWYGKEVIKVDRYYASSKTCSCGVKNEALELSDRTWKCNSCGSINNRDLLAAQNILKEGRRSSGDITNVETEVTKSMKRLEFNSKYKLKI